MKTTPNEKATPIPRAEKNGSRGGMTVDPSFQRFFRQAGEGLNLRPRPRNIDLSNFVST